MPDLVGAKEETTEAVVTADTLAISETDKKEKEKTEEALRRWMENVANHSLPERFIVENGVYVRDTGASLTADQKQVYDAVLAELKKAEGKISFGDMTIKKEEGRIEFPKNLNSRGLSARTVIDGKKHKMQLGFIYFDGDGGNIRLSDLETKVDNQVGAPKTLSMKEMLTMTGPFGGNIAWGNLNTAGKAPIATKTKTYKTEKGTEKRWFLNIR